MGRKRKVDLENDRPVTKRLRAVAEAIWQGNGRRMADDLSVSYWSLMRALRGGTVSESLLAPLARHPKVNIHWVLTGHVLDSPPPAQLADTAPTKLVSEASPTHNLEISFRLVRKGGAG